MPKRSKKKKDSEIPGSAYIVNPNAKPEAFMPTTTGQFIPNMDELLKGGVHIENIHITPKINPDEE